MNFNILFCSFSCINQSIKKKLVKKSFMSGDLSAHSLATFVLFMFRLRIRKGLLHEKLRSKKERRSSVHGFF